MLVERGVRTYQWGGANARPLRTALAGALSVCQPAPMPLEQLRATDGTILTGLAVVSTGRSYELATAHAEDGSLVALKSLRGADPATFAPVIRTELDALLVESEHLPREGRALEIDGPRGVESLIAYRWVDGITLAATIGSEHPSGLPVDLLVRVLKDVAQALSDLHRAGLVHRCLSPDHVIMTPSGRAVLIGLGNVVAKSGRPTDLKASVDDAYTAPEVRDELSGRFNTPRADVYGFGLLVSFAATGQRPTGSVHAPLTTEAFEQLARLPEGFSLLIARCLQPLQKTRIGSMRQILPLLEDADSLPQPDTPGFGPLVLIAPWLDDQGPGSLRVGHLSPGPLVDRPRAPPADASGPVGETASDVSKSSASPTQSSQIAPEFDGGATTPTVSASWAGRILSAAVIAATLYIAIRSIFDL